MANTSGGGAQTNKNGLKFEEETSLKDAFEKEGFVLNSINKKIHNVYYEEKQIGVVLKKNGFYEYFKLLKKINKIPVWKNYISKKLYPDEIFLNFKDKTLYIIEKKYQKGNGSVDEKLQTFQFKIYEFEKFTPILNDVDKIKYYYLTNDFYHTEKYKDLREYIKLNGSDIFENVIEFEKLGLYIDK